MPLVEASVTESATLSKHVHPLFVDFLARLLQMTSYSEPSTAHSSALFTEAWSKFSLLCIQWLTSENESILRQTCHLLTCFHVHTPTTVRMKKTSPRKVQFSDTAVEDDSAAVTAAGDQTPLERDNAAEQTNRISALLAHEEVQSLLSRVCRLCFEKSLPDTENAEDYLTLFVALCSIVSGKGLVKVFEAEDASELLKDVAFMLMKQWETSKWSAESEIMKVFSVIFKEADPKKRVLETEEFLTVSLILFFLFPLDLI